jgi:hypothetical protein
MKGFSLIENSYRPLLYKPAHLILHQFIRFSVIISLYYKMRVIMKTLEMLLVTNQQIDFSQFSNWKITSVENIEAAIEKIQSIDFDLIALENNFDQDLTAKLQKDC